MKIDIETKEFLKAINDFRTASRKKTGSVLKQVGKLVVRDAMLLTPPNAKNTRELVSVASGFQFFSCLAAVFAK